LNSTIEESLKNRADERRRTLKNFNHKFNTNVSARVDEIEKQPAYKRAGIELNEGSSDTNASRTSLGTDSNDDMQLRNNNSFLHDNVD
jgi:cell division protein FtsZ